MMSPVRLSGPLAARPAANAAVGARFRSTEGQTYVSTGRTWVESFELPWAHAQGIRSGLLSERPAPSTCVGWLYIDENGNEYEAFPSVWASVNSVNLS